MQLACGFPQFGTNTQKKDNQMKKEMDIGLKGIKCSQDKGYLLGPPNQGLSILGSLYCEKLPHVPKCDVQLLSHVSNEGRGKLKGAVPALALPEATNSVKLSAPLAPAPSTGHSQGSYKSSTYW